MVSPYSKEDIDLFWDVSLNETEIPILSTLTWQVDEIRSRVNGGFTDTQSLRSWELLDENSQSISVPVDIAIEPFSHRIWIADSDTIYVYDDTQDLPNMRVLANKNFDAMSVIEPSSYHISRGEEVQISYTWRRPITDIDKHRVYVYAPDGTAYSIVDGAFVTFDLNDTWITGLPDNRAIRASDNFMLPQRGDWLFFLEVHYTNGIQEIDQKIVSVDSKNALASFPLSIAGATIEGLDFDSSQNLWVLINVSGTRSKVKIIPHYDVMLIDYLNKILVFRENYDQIRVL